MPKIIKVISGGQTGADIAGLMAAKKLGLPTGGWAPKGWWTEKGKNEELRDTYGLIEAPPGYYDRTRLNAVNSDCTILFGNLASKGSALTIRYLDEAKKKYIKIDKDTIKAEDDFPFRVIEKVTMFLQGFEGQSLTVNVAGNRESVYPGIEDYVYTVCVATFGMFMPRKVRI